MDTKITEQITALKSALEIGQKEITEIEGRLKTKFENLPSEAEQKELLKNEVIYFYLKNFWEHYEFLTKKIEIEDDLKNFQFYIPTVRTLFENYGELLYFLNQNEKGQLGLYIGNYLLHLSDHYHFIAVGNSEIKNEYDRILTLVGSILSTESITFPTDINSFSNNSLKKSGFAFPSFEQIFKESYFSSLSSETFPLWQKDEPSNFYDKYYRSHSNYSHRSFTNQTTSATKNEVFWIIQFMYLIGQLMFELCDKKVFDNKFQSDRKQFTSNIAQAYPKLLEAWDEQRKQSV
jgi:hypothetical protein